MLRYVIRRTLEIVPVLFIIVTFVFLLVNVAGDPVTSMLGEEATDSQVQAMRESLGLDRPIWVQYGDYLWNVVHGNFGDSYRYGQPATQIVMERLPVTLTLAITGMLLAIVVAIPLGVLAAVRRGSALDTGVSSLSVLAKAMPNFWLGIMLILIFAITLRWLPVSGSGGWNYLVLPTIALATGVAAEITMLVRSSLVEELSKDYVKTARGKGLRSSRILYRHALRNSFVPVMSIVLLQFSGLIGGAIITETVFAWPGLGTLLVNAVTNKDLPVVQASVFVVAVLIILVNLLGDVIFRLSDRRIKL